MLSLIKNRSAVSLAENTIALAFAKGIDMLTQLLVMPRIIYLYGIEVYGNIAFYLVLMQYLLFVCDFGFNFNATKRIANSLLGKSEYSKILTSVCAAKILISILLIIILTIIFVFISSFSLLLYASFVVYVMFTSFSIDWLYLGTQKMIIPTILKFVARFLYVLCLFFVFDSCTNYEYVIMMDCFLPILIVIPSFFYAILKLKIRLGKVDNAYTKSLFKESWVLFSSSIFILFYRNINVLILKFIAGEYYTGIYASVEKISRAFQAVIEPISTALFPFIGSRGEDKKRMLFEVLSIAKIYSIILLLAVVIIIVLGEFILRVLDISGENALCNFYIMLVPFFFGSLNYFLGYVGLINLDKEKVFRASVIIVGIISIPQTLLLVYLLNNIGAAISVALAEFLLCSILSFKLIGMKKEF